MDELNRARIEELLETDELMVHDLRALEEGARWADCHQDLDLAFRLRLRLFEESRHSKTAFVAYGWCLGHYRRDPERFAAYRDSLLWGFKSIVFCSYAYPEIELHQIDGLLDEMEGLYREHGFSLRSVYELRFYTDVYTGRWGDLRARYERWEKEPRDQLTNCKACEADRRVEFWAFLEEHEKAVKAAQPLLGGRQSCNSVPEVTYGRVLRSLVILGDLETAEKIHRKGYRLTAGRDNYLFHTAEHLAYLCHVGNFAKGLKLVERHLKLTFETGDIDNQCRMFVAQTNFFDKLCGQRPACRLRLPRKFPLYDEEGKYEISALAAWFAEAARNLGERFNRRNRNDGYTTLLRRHLCY